MGWEVGLIEVIAFIYFIGPQLRRHEVALSLHTLLASGYAVDYTLHMEARSESHHRYAVVIACAVGAVPSSWHTAVRCSWHFSFHA